MEDHDAVPDGEIANACAGGNDVSGGFMAEDARGRVRAGGNLLEVSAADAAGMHADEEFAGTNPRDWDGLHADVVDAVINGGKHVGRDFTFLPPIADLSCYGQE